MTFNQPLQGNLLPVSLCELDLGPGFNQPLEGIRWPAQLHVSCVLDAISITRWAPRICRMVSKHSCWVIYSGNLRYVSLPSALLRLTLGNSFPLQRHPLFWPPRLEELSIRQQFSQVPLDFVFPDSLRKIDCDGNCASSRKICCSRSNDIHRHV